MFGILPLVVLIGKKRNQGISDKDEICLLSVDSHLSGVNNCILCVSVSPGGGQSEPRRNWTIWVVLHLMALGCSSEGADFEHVSNGKGAQRNGV